MYNYFLTELFLQAYMKLGADKIQIYTNIYIYIYVHVVILTFIFRKSKFKSNKKQIKCYHALSNKTF